jgi:hypothetical protein
MPGAKVDAVLVDVVPDRGTRFARLVAKLGLWVAVFGPLTVGSVPFDAVAQITGPLLPYVVPPVTPQAPRSEFEPIGLRLGDFFWYPRAELDEAYNSNIFATSTSPTYDLITAFQPSFDLLSSFPRNALNLHGSSLVQVYADHPAQNTQDGSINIDGRLDVTSGSYLYGNALVGHQHISYGSPNSPGNIAQPVTYWDYIARAGYAQGGRRFTYGVDLGVIAAQYNAASLVGGGILPQSSQDASISDAAVRAAYEIIPDYLGYVRFDGSLYNYWHTVPGGTRPNSTTYRIDAGLQILPRHIISGQVYIGYLVQNFAQPGLGSTTSPDYGGRLVWSITPLTTLTFTGLLSFNTGTPSSGTTFIPGPAGNGYLAQTFTANADHELLRNLLLNLNAGYENDTFQGITRTDNVFTATAGVKYLMNRNLYLGGSFSYYQRSSTFAGASYTQSIFTLRAGTQF